MYKVQKHLQFGYVYQDQNGYWIYSVKNPKHLYVLIGIFNGNLFLEKRIVQFRKWVLLYNKKYGTNIKPICNPRIVDLNTYWLTGFADADGSFGLLLSFRKDSQKNRLRVRFYLDQAYSKTCLQKLQKLFGGTLSNKYKDSNKYQRLIVDTYKGAEILIPYFQKFPPLTTRMHVRFIRYFRVYRFWKEKIWNQKESEIKHLISLNIRFSTRYSPVDLIYKTEQDQIAQKAVENALKDL